MEGGGVSVEVRVREAKVMRETGLDSRSDRVIGRESGRVIRKRRNRVGEMLGKKWKHFGIT